MSRKSIFLFPGQGSQYVGMGKDLYENFSEVRHLFEEAEDSLKFKLKKLCFEGPESELRLTQNAQPAILCLSFAGARVFMAELGIKPYLLAGHSLGEYSALVVAESLSFSDALGVVRERGRAMQEAVPIGKGGMAAFLGVEAKMMSELCEEVTNFFNSSGEFVVPANFNGAGQVVVSGTLEAVRKSVEVAKARGVRGARFLEVSAPFHCRLMEPAARRMANILETISFSSPKIPYIANVDGALYQDEEGICDRLVRQIPNPVQWEASMDRLKEEGIEEAFEVGPGKVLTGLLRRMNKNIKLLNIETSKDLKGIFA